MPSIGERIKKYRKNKNLTQQQLADLLGKSKSIIQKYEANSTNVSIEVLREISDILGVKLHALLYEEGSESFSTFQYEDEFRELFNLYSKDVESRLLELNDNLDEQTFLSRIYALLEALDLDFIYDKTSGLIYIGTCYTEPSFGKTSEKVIVTNIDNFLFMLKNIISIRNNFFDVSKTSDIGMNEVMKKIVDNNRDLKNSKLGE